MFRVLQIMELLILIYQYCSTSPLAWLIWFKKHPLHFCWMQLRYQEVNINFLSLQDTIINIPVILRKLKSAVWELDIGMDNFPNYKPFLSLILFLKKHLYKVALIIITVFSFSSLFFIIKDLRRIWRHSFGNTSSTFKGFSIIWSHSFLWNKSFTSLATPDLMPFSGLYIST